MPAINVVAGVPNTPVRAVLANFTALTLQERNLRIVGITRDSNGNPLAACTVQVYRTDTQQIVDQETSDANGNYMVQVPVGFSQAQPMTWYVVAYKAGSPDVAGTTVNTLQGT